MHMGPVFILADNHSDKRPNTYIANLIIFILCHIFRVDTIYCSGYLRKEVTAVSIALTFVTMDSLSF